MNQSKRRKSKKNYEPIVNLNGEVWKPIKGYEGLYEVSNKGRVKSLNYHSTGKEFLLRHDVRNSHHRVTLSKGGKVKKIFVHRIVYGTFVGNLPKYKPTGIGNGDKMWVINHKDENPHNNCIENLEVVTITENNRYGSFGQKVSEGKSMQVYQYDLNGNLIKKWKSTMECDKNGFSSSKVSKCCMGKRLTHKGFIWSYKEFTNEELQRKIIHTKHTLDKHLIRPIYQYTQDGELVKIWKNEAEPKKYGYRQSNISNCCLGKQKTHQGFIWSFEILNK